MSEMRAEMQRMRAEMEQLKMDSQSHHSQPAAPAAAATAAAAAAAHAAATAAAAHAAAAAAHARPHRLRVRLAGALGELLGHDVVHEDEVLAKLVGCRVWCSESLNPCRNARWFSASNSSTFVRYTALWTRRCTSTASSSMR